MTNRSPALSQMLAAPTSNLIGGRWQKSQTSFSVRDKYTGDVIAEVSQATPPQVAEAVSAAAAAFETERLSAVQMARVLRRVRDFIEHKRALFTEALISETGFTQADAANEIDRSLVTLELSAEEGKRITGQMVPFAASPGHASRIGFTMRFPLGVVCAITPFNSPLNTVLHKVAPALAAGNAVVLKPSALTPLTAALLCETFLEAGLPPRLLTLLQGEGDTVGTALLNERAIAFYAFTGSTRVGRLVQQAAGLRKTQLELGSIASTILCADADMDRALPKIANAAFRKAGQVCTSVQMLFIEKAVFESVKERLIEEVLRMPAGNPRDPNTRVGPMIGEDQARRAEAWILEAREQGANQLAGGQRSGSVLAPTVLEGVRPGMKVVDREVFCPLLSILPFEHLDEAINGANATPYGLSCGLFTRDLTRGLNAARRLRFGAIHVNETSSARADVMPFGGVKDSGFGHEGPAYAVREMTEERLVTLND